MAIDLDHLRTVPTDKIQHKIAKLDQLYYVTEDYNMKQSLRRTMEELKEEVERRNSNGTRPARNRRLR